MERTMFDTPCLALALAVVGAACDQNTPTYFTPPGGPIEAGGQGRPGEATAQIALPFRSPTDQEREALNEESKRLKFKVPWLKRHEVAISVQYAITNLGSETGKAQLLVDGASELVSYDSAAMYRAMVMMAANPEDVVVLSLVQGTPVLIEPGKTLSGIVREDDFVEAALDLDALGRWMAAPAEVLVNHSEINPVGLAKMPAGVVVPAFYSLIVTLKASSHMRLEFLVRVRDDANRLLRPGDDGVFAPKPTSYMPPAMMMR